MNMSHKNRVEAYAIALSHGFVDLQKAVSWADSVITQEESPDPALIDASLSVENMNDMLSALHRVSGVTDPMRIARLLFADMLQAVRSDPRHAKRIARVLYSMALEGIVPDDTAESEMLYFDDAFALAISQDYGTEAEVKKELGEFLSRYENEA